VKVVWSPVALERVGEIAGFIAQDSASAAKKWVGSVFAKVKRLGKFPESGRSVPEIKRPDIREVLHGHYRIVYRIRQGQIAVLTVRHGKQRLPSSEIV
jgi:toxin ParE1/3/4